MTTRRAKTRVIWARLTALITELHSLGDLCFRDSRLLPRDSKVRNSSFRLEHDSVLVVRVVDAWLAQDDPAVEKVAGRRQRTVAQGVAGVRVEDRAGSAAVEQPLLHHKVEEVVGNRVPHLAGDSLGGPLEGGALTLKVELEGL